MKKTHILLTLYIGALYASNLLGGKLIALPFLERGITVAIIIFPLLFFITDIIGEVYGKQKSKEFVHLGMFSLVMLLLWQIFSIFINGVESNDRFIHFNNAYSTVFGLSISFTIASLVAYVIGQHVDVTIFHFIKSKRGEKHLWLRNNISTIIAQFVDTSVWTLIAFAPKLRDGTFNFFSLYASIIIPYWIAKIIIAFIDTPFVYLGVQWLKKKEEDKPKPSKKILIGLFIFLGIFTFSGNQSFAYQEMIIKNIKSEGIGTKPVRVIKVVLDGEDFVVNSLATTGGDSLENLMHQVGGYTALNGIFFCPSYYSYCHGQTYSNFERVFNGEVDEQTQWRPDTGVRGIFGFEKNGTPLFVQNNLSEMPGVWTDINKDKINDIHFGLGNFPIMVLGGDNMVKYSDEYLDTKLRGRKNRQFICSTKDKKTIYMGVIGLVNLYEAANIMIKSFGCWEGLNLDAGSSQNMIYKNTTLQRKSQHIMDAWVVVNRTEYKKITGVSDNDLPKLSPYRPDDNYLLSDKEQEKINLFGDIIWGMIKSKEKIERKSGLLFKSSLIKTVRTIISTPKIQSNPKKKKFFNSLLIKLYSLGY